MEKLEATILAEARQRLKELRYGLYDGEDDLRDVTVHSSAAMLGGLTFLAHLADSGLSEPAIRELLSIEREAMEAYDAAKLVGL